MDQNKKDHENFNEYTSLEAKNHDVQKGTQNLYFPKNSFFTWAMYKVISVILQRKRENLFMKKKKKKKIKCKVYAQG